MADRVQAQGLDKPGYCRVRGQGFPGFDCIRYRSFRFFQLGGCIYVNQTMASDLPIPGQFPELDAETRVPILVGMSTGFVLASTIAVGLRLYTRGFVVRNLGMDDATIAFAQVSTTELNLFSQHQ